MGLWRQRLLEQWTGGVGEEEESATVGTELPVGAGTQPEVLERDEQGTEGLRSGLTGDVGDT